MKKIKSGQQGFCTVTMTTALFFRFKTSTRGQESVSPVKFSNMSMAGYGVNDERANRVISDFLRFKVTGISTTFHYIKPPNTIEDYDKNNVHVAEFQPDLKYIFTKETGERAQHVTPIAIISHPGVNTMYPGQIKRHFLKRPAISYPPQGEAQDNVWMRNPLLNTQDLERYMFGRVWLCGNTHVGADDIASDSSVHFKDILVKVTNKFYVSCYGMKP